MKQGIWLVFIPIGCGLIAGISLMVKSGPDVIFGQLLSWIMGAGLVFILAYFVLPTLADRSKNRIRLPDGDFKVRMHRISPNTVRFSGNGKSVLAVVDRDGIRIWRLDEHAHPIGSPIIPNENAYRFGKTPLEDLGEYVKERMLGD